MTDTFNYDNISEGGDRIFGFNTGSPGTGGDVLEIADVLVGFAGSTVADAVAGGFLTFADSGDGGTDVRVDADGGSDAFQSLAILDGLGFIDLATSLATLDDNIG